MLLLKRDRMRFMCLLFMPSPCAPLTPQDTAMFFLAVLTAPVAMLPCFARTYVTIRGAYGEAVFRLRPKIDMQLDALSVANHLAGIIENLKATRRHGGAATAPGGAQSGAAKASIGGDGSGGDGGALRPSFLPPMPPSLPGMVRNPFMGQ